MLGEKLTKSILRTTDNYISALEKAGILTVGDLLNHFPRDYEDRTNVLDSFSLINIKEKNTIIVKLLTITSTKTANNKLLTKAILEDKNGFLSEAVWFNRKYLATSLKGYEQKKVIVSGSVKYAFGKVTFQNPEVETDLDKLAGEIVPIYPELNYIPSKWIEGKIEVLKSFIKEIPEDLPEDIIKKYNFISKRDAVLRVHFPKNKLDIEQAKYRLAYGELFDINYKSIGSKMQAFKESEGRSLSIKMNPELVKELLSFFPFDFTNHQKIVLFQILKDMEKPHCMQRLLEGDVGTGKTAVAFVAALHAIIESRKNPPILNQESFNYNKESQHYNQESPHLNHQESPHPNPLPKGEGIIMYSQKEYNPRYIVELSKELRKNQTESEGILWELLRNRKFNDLKFRRQHPFGRYVADFYCDEIKLVIELDGKIHENQKDYDAIRDEVIKTYGVNILRFNSEDVYNNIDKIFNKIIPFIPLPLGKVRGGQKTEYVSNIGNRIQVAIMAPTEILARQHFEGMQDFLMKFGISSHLLVGSLTPKQKAAVKADIKSGNIDLVIGTHALVQEDVVFNNLGFVVVDEQHRFGVKQREVLEKGFGNKSGLVPHNLNMTATPIPRTLALTLYGDQDLSVINEYPKGRKDIFTKVAKNEEERQQIILFVRSELEKGRQVFWISPLVEESEKIDLANAINTYENLQAIFHPFKVGLLHGKMRPKEKDEIMKAFANNEIQILSSTSVVEVGVNVPNSTIMCIEGAERFGLSQLHQFRGRVGRGSVQSYCYLFPTTGNSTDRLKAMEKTNNGFELAEIDLELRGPGEVYGVRQSGVPDLKIASLTDLELISQIREDIEELFEKKDK
ncbi:MAG: DUF559 domain-containing protein [Candidatus Gracilibacteria bacterium]|nr:DUF559 domain-containing protein [Candidatus Gracilibacteria bacterium]